MIGLLRKYFIRVENMRKVPLDGKLPRDEKPDFFKACDVFSHPLGGFLIE